jgi:hypothetical protein
MKGERFKMRTISALIAATFCALALSESAVAADRGLARPQAQGWLEFRTAFAAEKLWPDKTAKTKGGSAQSPTLQVTDRPWPEELEGAAGALQHRYDVLRNWSNSAQRILTNQGTSYDVAGN